MGAPSDEQLVVFILPSFSDITTLRYVCFPIEKLYRLNSDTLSRRIII